MPQSPDYTDHADGRSAPLLGPGDPHPVLVHDAGGPSPFLLTCDHAGRRVPAALGDMGVWQPDWDRHIAWDIGIAGVCARLAPLLGATWIEQLYSRLVIDCNRRPGHPTSIPPVSDGTPVPANARLSEAARQARADAVFAPYHRAIAAELDRRQAAGRMTILLAMHSFTPVLAGSARPWQAGVLFNRDPRLSLALAVRLRRAGYIVGENEPYTLTDDSDYTVPVHAEARALPYVELEIRQDLIANADGQSAWAALLASTLPDALAEMGRASRP